MARPLPEVLMVVLDTYCPEAAGPGAAQREKMIRFAGTVIDHALSRGYLVGLALARPGGVEYHRPAPGRGQLRALLDALADVEEKVDRPLRETLARVEPGAVRSAVVMVAAMDHARAPGGGGNMRVPFGCRRLVVVNGRNLDEYFEDDPLAAKSEGNAE
jgi:uncharacterized protein (DUF58 family)